MHHIFEITEITAYIFEYTDTATNAACARVCRAWHDTALDVLWCHVDRLDLLLKLLGPTPQLLTFVQHHISGERWDRFSIYANRVRRLECLDAPPRIHYQTFSTLSISRPVLPLIPNLTHLTWRKDPARPAASLITCLLFLTPKLRFLSVETGKSASQGDLFAIDNFFQDAVRRSPRIEHLEFRSDIPFRNLGPVLSERLFSGLPELKSVLLSNALFSSDVVTALAKCPLLEVVRLTHMSERSEDEETSTDDLQNFMPVMEHGAFPCIRDMDIKAHLWNVTMFLQPPFPASRLRRLHVRTLIQETNENVGLFFDLIADACPNIEALALSVCKRRLEESLLAFPFSYLEPLLKCKCMKTFIFEIPVPVDIDDMQAARMAMSWPRLQKLSLSPYPRQLLQAEQYLTLTALASFARYCPDLQHLEVYVRSSVIPPQERRKLVSKLQRLVLGFKNWDYNPRELALFLADVTPLTCSIRILTIRPADQFVSLQFVVDQRNKVLEAIPMLRRVHAQYRERLKCLEEEVRRMKLLVCAEVA